MLSRNSETTVIFRHEGTRDCDSLKAAPGGGAKTNRRGVHGFDTSGVAQLYSEHQREAKLERRVTE